MRFPSSSFQQALRVSPLRAFSELSASGERLPSFRRGYRRIFLVTHPDDVQRVLYENAANYVKARTRDFLGRGIVASEGDSWTAQRAAGALAFRAPEREAGFSALDGFIDELLNGWNGNAVVASLPALSRLNLLYVGDTLFGVDLTPHLEALGSAIAILTGREPSAFSRALRRSLGRDSLYARAQWELERICGLVAASIERGEAKPTFLTRALSTVAAKVPLAHQVANYLLAAGETTTVALAWTLQELSRHPEAQEACREERGGEPLYLKAAVKESLRLHPPVWAMARRSLASDTLGGRRIGKSAEVLVLPYLVHRSAELWADPERFFPERFLDGKRAHAFAYLPFGAGPRSCLGAPFAMEEIVHVVGRILKAFELSPAGSKPVSELPLYTLRPAEGAPLKLKSESR